MDRFFFRLRLAALAIFAITVVASFSYHIFWKWPEERCLEKGDWWDWRERVCAHPVLISDITGRTIQDKQAEAAARTIARPKTPPAP